MGVHRFFADVGLAVVANNKWLFFDRSATVMHVKLSNSHGTFGGGRRLVRLLGIKAPQEFLEFHF